MLSGEWLSRYRLLENFNKVERERNGNENGNGNAYDRGDYNSSFALRAVELKTHTCIYIKISFHFSMFCVYVALVLAYHNPKVNYFNI